MTKAKEITVEFPCLMVASSRGFGVILAPPRRDYVVIYWFDDQADYRRACVRARRMREQNFMATPLQYSKTHDAYVTLEAAIRKVSEGDRGHFWPKKLAELTW